MPLENPAELALFVERCIIDRVALIAVWGPGCEGVEDEIDEIVVGDGIDEHRYITTSSRPDERLEDAVEMAAFWVTDDGRSGVEVVRL